MQYIRNADIYNINSFAILVITNYAKNELKDIQYFTIKR